jgi:hypothetical protein
VVAACLVAHVLVAVGPCIQLAYEDRDEDGELEASAKQLIRVLDDTGEHLQQSITLQHALCSVTSSCAHTAM